MPLVPGYTFHDAHDAILLRIPLKGCSPKSVDIYGELDPVMDGQMYPCSNGELIE